MQPFASNSLDPRSARIMPWLVAVAFFMQMLDGTILNTALPGMAADLNVQPLRMQSVIIAYMLTTALLIPASGWLAERMGTKRVFVFAVVLFTLGSLFCAISPTLEMLVLSRVIQGVGGALMVPVGRLAVIKAYPRHELVRVLSFVTMPGLIGPLMGPMAGGFFVQYASWHWIFLINLPVGIVGAVLAWYSMPDMKVQERTRFDGWGFVLFSLSMVLISLAMEGFGELRLPKVEATLLCIGGLILLSLYWIRAVRSPQPLLSPELFRTRSFTVGILGNLFARLGSGAMPFLLPLFLQLGMGYSPLTAGLTMIPSAAAGIAGKQFLPPLLRRYGFRRFLVVNTILLGCLIAVFSKIGAHTSYIGLLALLSVFGAINSMQFTAMNSITLIDLKDKEVGSGNSLLSVTMQISAVTGVAMAAALLDGFTVVFGHNPTPIQLRDAFHQTFIWVGAMSAASALIFSQTPKESGNVVIHED